MEWRKFLYDAVWRAFSILFSTGVIMLWFHDERGLALLLLPFAILSLFVTPYIIEPHNHKE
jgi:hypothetical protein